MNEYLIYPKQFQHISIPVEKNRCFVIMPFEKEMDYIYGTIKQGLNEANYLCNRVDEISGATPIINKIITEIICSRFVIADLTDCNANVFYELGIAHSFKEASNIIILKQKGSNVPFDVTHLTYIEYDTNNLKYLVASILKTINENKVMVDFRDVLNTRGIIPYVKSDEELFITYIENKFRNELSELICILNNDINKIPDIDLENLLIKYENVLSYTMKSENEEIIEGVLAVYKVIIVTLSKFDFTQKSVIEFLCGSFFEKNNIADNKNIVWQTDLAVALAKNNKLISIVMPWIINYFSQTQTASVDLNRYKLETFLMTSENSEVNKILCDAVFDKNCYIRERMADIIGEKRLRLAKENLQKQLVCEENYYTAVSIMEALGKLKTEDSLPYILNWIQEFEKNIINEKQFFVLKHARIALIKLVTESSKHIIDEFDAKYGDFLKNYFIL